MKEKYRLVYILWRDAYGVSAEWQDIAAIQAGPTHCESVGWLVHEDKDCIVVIPHISKDGHKRAKHQGCGDMTIPKCSIRKRIYLKK